MPIEPDLAEPPIEIRRRLSVGAEVQQPGGVHFRVWAPRAHTVSLLIDGAQHRLEPEGEGHFSAYVARAGAGSRYGYRLDDDQDILPDPASRFQPDGPAGLSCVVDPGTYRWEDEAWGGIALDDQVIEEIHLGTFTAEGTYAAAAEKLPLLAEIGVSLIELMPVAEFPGRFGWGYDGVLPYAPTHLYGGPDELRAFIDRAHRIGLGVMLDVVYNHFGPDENCLPRFSDRYLTDRYPNEWGVAVNFDGPGCAAVRAFVCENAAYWIGEFHFDGLRLDATQQIFDASDEHILAALARHARQAAGARKIVLVAENEPQDGRMVRSPARGGYGLDALWNDDFHHSARVALTGRSEAYYSDYAGSANELLACAKHGFLYQGQRSRWQDKGRGAPALDLDPAQRVNFIENHDQVANSAAGRRLCDLAGAGRLRAITALLLIGPGIPMLFQGQEFASPTPFLYFADHRADLAAMVAKGRRTFLSQFPSLEPDGLDAPESAETYKKCVLDWGRRIENVWALALHRDLIALRRADPVFRQHGRKGIDGAVLAPECFLLRFFNGGSDERLMVVNLGPDLSPPILPQPLLAPPAGEQWHMLWSSEARAYGGEGVRAFETKDGLWAFTGHATVILSSRATVVGER